MYKAKLKGYIHMWIHKGVKKLKRKELDTKVAFCHT